jgi:hypothetical protein
MATILGLLSRWSWLSVIAENGDGTMESFFPTIPRKDKYLQLRSALQPTEAARLYLVLHTHTDSLPWGRTATPLLYIVPSLMI